MNLTPDDYARLASLFAAAVELDGPAQQDFLAQVDPHLQHSLATMLHADQSTHPLLDAGAASLASDLLGEPETARCGPYQLLEVLGEGGMGIVYRGHRDDLNSEAAIKVLRDAWISPARRQRFAREQRTLASLQHPGIAKLLDAGVTEAGTPWIAMECIDGLPLSQYCEAHQLNVPQRVDLMRRVCDAVQYAHARAVIHRDLKPSNILVDSTGHSRLVDFGLARHLDDALGEEATRPEFRMLTPAYAAPEQQRGEPCGVFTDVYALGIILAELLSHRRTESAAWDELDLICSTASHADPGQRYASAQALAADLERVLKQQPLAARPPSASYKLAKFIARNRAAVIAASLAFLLLATSATYFTLRLRQSRDEALQSAARAQRIQTFLLNLFEGGDAAAGPSRDLTVATLIDRGVRDAAALDREPAVQGEVYETLGRMYGRLGRHDDAQKLLQQALERGAGKPQELSSLTELAMTQSELGHLTEAEATARRAWKRSVDLLGPTHDLTLTAAEAVGRILTERGEYAQAVEVLAPLLTTRQQLKNPESLAATASALATAHFYAGHYDESRQLNLQALDARRKAYGDRHPLVADDWLSLGAIEFDTGRYTEAEKFYRRTLDVRRAWYGPDHPDTASAETMLGRALVYQEKHPEARQLLEHALTVQTKVFGPQHDRVASSLNDLGNIHVAEGRYREAERCYQQMEDNYRQSRGDAHYLVATAMSNRANVHLREGNYARAEAIMHDVVRRFEQALTANHVNTAIAQIRLGRALARQKKWREVTTHSRLGYDTLSAQAKAPVSWLDGARLDLATAYAALDDTAQAKRFEAELPTRR